MMDNAAKDTILIGDHAILRYRYKILKGEDFLFPEPPNPITDGVELIASPVTDTVAINDNMIELETSFIITSFDSGSYKLPSFTAYKYKSDGTTDTLHFDGGELEVATIQIDTSSFRPFDVKEQMNYPFTVKEVLPWLGIVVILLALVYMIVRAVKNLKEKKNIFGKSIVTDPPHITALKRLEKLREDKLWVKDQKEFYTQITDVIREYVEARYNMQAMEKTSNEIIGELSDKK